MSNMSELLDEVERLPSAEKWQLVRHVLRSLEHEQVAPAPGPSWHDRMLALYGVLADVPLERPPQLPLVEREPIE
jgi:hypothetical protein